MKQILEVIAFLHENKVMHRDIKPENLLLSKEGLVKLIDFGITKEVQEGQGLQTAGVCTRYYKSPEILFGSKEYDYSIDIWAAGCLFGELFKKKPIFNGTTDFDQITKVFGALGAPTEETWPGVSELPHYMGFKYENVKGVEGIMAEHDISPIALDLLKKMLELNPKNRPSAQECLQHEYFT